MLNKVYLCIYLFTFHVFVVKLKAQDSLRLIKGGGYTARFCLRTYDQNVTLVAPKASLTCHMSEKLCDGYHLFDCVVPCGFHTEGKQIYFKNFDKELIWIEKPNFKFLYLQTDYSTSQILTIGAHSSAIASLSEDQISVLLSNNFSCLTKSVQNELLQCTLYTPNIEMNQLKLVNVSVKYGSSCNGFQYVGQINVLNLSLFRKVINNLHWIFLSIFIVGLPICVYLLRKRKWLQRRFNELELEESNFSNIQQKNFLEYQKSAMNFQNIGKLTPHHLLSFHDYLTKILNVKFKLSLNNNLTGKLEEFRQVLLNEESLVKWIDKVEGQCKVNDKCLVAAFLTLFLFPYPGYFIRVIRKLLFKLVDELKVKSEEISLFTRPETIIENIIVNWISLSIFQNIKKGEIGKTFFNLCRSIKCKIHSGPVDMYSSKAKYSLTFDNLLLGDLDYDILSIEIHVKLLVNTVNESLAPVTIEHLNLRVEVLSLDSISQVKDKIIDRALVDYFQSEEDLESIQDKMDLCLKSIDQDEYILEYIKHDIKLEIKDFDSTSIVTDIDRKYIVVNTMKHYNITNGTKFFFCKANMRHSISLFTVNTQSFYLGEEVPIHLILPDDECHDAFKISKNRFVYNPIIECSNPESYLFMLMAVKKSLKPFIDDFIKQILKVKCKQNTTMNVLYFPKYLLEDTMTRYADDYELERQYLVPVYFLFSLLDEIGNSLKVNEEIIRDWKSKSVIQCVWGNLLKNPTSVFSMHLTEPVYGCLDIIAKVLIDSCSGSSPYFPDALNVPVNQQLFLKDVINKYSLWWSSFVETTAKINDDVVETIMFEILEKNFINNYKVNALKTLQMLSKTIIISERPTTTSETIWSFDSIR